MGGTLGECVTQGDTPLGWASRRDFLFRRRVLAQGNETAATSSSRAQTLSQQAVHERVFAGGPDLPLCVLINKTDAAPPSSGTWSTLSASCSKLIAAAAVNPSPPRPQNLETPENSGPCQRTTGLNWPCAAFVHLVRPPSPNLIPVHHHVFFLLRGPPFFHETPIFIRSPRKPRRASMSD